MTRGRLLGAGLLVAASAVLVSPSPAQAQLRPHGAAEGTFLVAPDGDPWGAALTVDLWAPVGVFRFGGALGVGALTSDVDADSRILMPVGASAALILGEDRKPFFEVRLRAGAWGGATNQGLAAGAWLAGGAYFGYALGPNVSLGAGVSGWFLLGHGDIVAIAPGLTLHWVPFEY